MRERGGGKGRVRERKEEAVGERAREGGKERGRERGRYILPLGVRPGLTLFDTHAHTHGRTHFSQYALFRCLVLAENAMDCIIRGLEQINSERE